jgi:hypothetical protein
MQLYMMDNALIPVLFWLGVSEITGEQQTAA